jgi:hypothetical protein
MPGENEEAGFSEAQLAQLTTVIAKVANETFTARDKQSEKKRKEEIRGEMKGAFDAFLPELDKVLETKLEGIKPAVPKPGADGAPAGGAALPLHETPEWKGMLKKHSDLEQSVKRAEEARAAERAKSRDVALRQTVAEGLVKRGIDATRAPHALGYVLDAKKLAKYAGDDDDASITFRDADGSEVDLDTGLDGWVKSDDAKIYLPPRGSAGSGDRGGGRRASGGQKTEASFEDVGNFVLDAFPSMSGPRR